jgi:type II secretory pathway pseudopilin PulG
METGKTAKYFKYAIGEIILVVIGILIALSINNWNQARINAQKEQQYLLGLKNDLTKQITQFGRGLAFFPTPLSSLKILFQIIKQPLVLQKLIALILN